MCRWPEGEVIHVQLSKYAHRVFCEGVEGVVGACRKRLSWLKKGSRELFGTLLETKIVIVVDTSVSMGKRLDLLKEKLQELIQVNPVQTTCTHTHCTCTCMDTNVLYFMFTNIAFKLFGFRNN